MVPYTQLSCQHQQTGLCAETAVMEPVILGGNGALREQEGRGCGWQSPPSLRLAPVPGESLEGARVAQLISFVLWYGCWLPVLSLEGL